MFQILEKLLDKEIHQLFKAPPISSYLSPAGAKASSSSTTEGSTAQGPSDDMNNLSNHLVNMTMEEPRGDNVVRPKVNRTSTRPRLVEILLNRQNRYTQQTLAQAFSLSSN